MTTMDIMKMRNEICYFLRSSDVISTSVRGVTRASNETWTVGVGGEATHTLAHNPVRNIKTLTINGNAKYYLRDYTFVDTTGIITWNSALVQNDVVLITYDYGTGDKIYPDFPRDDLTLTSFPRIGIELTSVSTQPLGLGGTNHISDVVITIIVWVSANKDTSVAGGFGGLTDLENTMTAIRSAFRTGAKTFYTFNWITPLGTAPITKSTNDKIMQHSQDFIIKFNVE